MEYGIVPVLPTGPGTTAVDWQLAKDGFHRDWENVKHLAVLLALIHDAGTAIQ
jgi:hypothetical protein